MSDVPRSDSEGRPGPGAEMAQTLGEAAARRPRARNPRPLVHLLPFIRRHIRFALAAAFFLLLSTSATLGLTAAARLVVDRGFGTGTLEALNASFLGLGAVALVLAISTAMRFYFITRLGERVVTDLRVALYEKILRFDQSMLLELRTGEILSRMTADMTIIESVVGSSASIALRNLLSLIGATILLAIVSPRLTLFVMLLAPLIIAPMFIFGRKVRSLSTRAQDEFAQAMGYAGESIDALDTVQAFSRENLARDRFSQAVEAAFARSLQRITARSTMTALVIVLVFGGVAVVLWAGAQSVLEGRMSGGTLVQFVFLSILAAGSVGALGEVWGEVQKAAGASERIAELLKLTPKIAAPASPALLVLPARGEIRFEGVDFTYPGRPDLPALRGFNLIIAPGETVALVGPSGAGKSTVLRLLLRFYDPDAGTIRFDGIDIRQLDPAALREQMALVSQEAPLFSGSARENIQFGRPDADATAILEAARSAEADGFLNALPDGFDTPLGERARTLSGGQRQRLAIARALVRQAPVLLLDEATSALDAQNERLVQQALANAMQGRTTLVIAHRLSTVQTADRIVVMEQGRVVEQGRHNELIQTGGLYASLAKLQFSPETA